MDTSTVIENNQSTTETNRSNNGKSGYDELIEEYSQYIKVRIDDKPKPLMWALYSLQHTLGHITANFMVPVIIGSAIGLSPMEIARWVNLALIGVGIATLLQTLVGNRFPIFQGSSIAFAAPMILIAKTYGMDAVFFSVIIVGIIEAALGYSRLIGYVRKVFTPVVIAPTIALVGLSVIPVAVKLGSSSPIAVLITMIVILIFGLGFKMRLRSLSILIGLVVSTIIAIPLGIVDFSMVSKAPAYMIPTLFPWGISFSGIGVAVLLIGMVVSIVESLGDYYTTSIFAGKKMEEHHINRGIGTEGIGVIVGGLIGGMPVSSYSANAALIGATGVASRWVVAGAGFIAIILGFFPKVGAIFVSLPQAVVAGGLVVLLGTVLMGGIKQVERITITPRNMTIIGSAIIGGMIASSLDYSAVAGMPQAIKSLLESAMGVGALIAIVLDQLVPGSSEERGLSVKQKTVAN